MTERQNRRGTEVATRQGAQADLIEQALAMQEALEQELMASPDVREAYEDAKRRRNLFRTFNLVRRVKGISQVEMAEAMKTSQSAISDIEKGLKDPRLSTLQRMARAVGLELHVHLARGPWVFLYTWRSRDLLYHSSVQPMRVETDDNFWIAVLTYRAPDFGKWSHPDSPEVRPMSVRDPAEDNYLSRNDVDSLNVTAGALPGPL